MYSITAMCIFFWYHANAKQLINVFPNTNTTLWLQIFLLILTHKMGCDFANYLSVTLQEDQWDLLLWDSAQGLAAIITAFEQNSCQSQWGGKQNIVHPESPFSAIVITMSNIFFLFGKMPRSFDETDTAAAMFISIVYNLEALFSVLFKAILHFHHFPCIIRKLAHNGINGKLVAVKGFLKKQDVYKWIKKT